MVTTKEWAGQSAQSGGNINPGGNHGQRHGGSAGSRGHSGGATHHSRQAQYAPSAPEFHLETQNRFNGLGEENN